MTHRFVSFLAFFSEGKYEEDRNEEAAKKKGKLINKHAFLMLSLTCKQPGARMDESVKCACCHCEI